MNTKTLTGYIEKAAEDSDYDGTFVLSSDSPDRDGDVIQIDGWQLKNFKRNPVALWQHDHGSPVGRWENIRVDGKRLVADLVLATTRLATMTKQLIDDGILRAVSVGFVPIEYEPLNKENPNSGWNIKAAELLEASLVSVPANQDALLLSKSMGLTVNEKAAIFSDFGPSPESKSADPALLDRAKSLLSGKSADQETPKFRQEVGTMTLSEKIKASQDEMVALRDELAVATEKYAEDASDENRELVEAFAQKIEQTEKHINTLEMAEKAMMNAVVADAPDAEPVKAPGVVTTVKNYDKAELIFRQAAVKMISHVQNTSIDQVIRDRYPQDKGLQAIVKAASDPAQTTVAGWAGNLLSEQMMGLVDLLSNNSVYGAIRGRGMSLNFGGSGSIKIPARAATPNLAGGFVGEAAPIRVGQLGFTSQTLTPHKMAVISTMSQEIVDASSSQIETIVRQAMLDDTSKALDTVLLDATAGSAIRPAGLLAGVTSTTSAGNTVANIVTDLKALLGGFNTDDAAKNLVIIINPQRVLGLATATNAVGEMQFAAELAQGRLMGIPVATSANVATDEVHCVNAGEFVTAYDGPRFQISNTAALHMEDTAPAEIVSATGPTTADPVRSLFQTDTVGIRMILPVTWAMRRADQVSSLDTVAW